MKWFMRVNIEFDCCFIDVDQKVMCRNTVGVYTSVIYAGTHSPK